jgi:Zn-dependent M28 family amino/carboxypeptidase
VVARIEGSDPELRGETVVHTAHWDHFGWDPRLPGTKSGQVYHGAIDNASGVASLLALARAYRSLPRAPSRSILFICTTGEERGLLGARYYVKNPLYPLERTPGEINIDGINAFGRTKDITILGMGRSTLDDMGGGVEYIGKPAGYADEVRDMFTAERYHKVQDTLRADYDFSGAVEDLQILFRLGNELAETRQYPQWKPGSEFSRPNATRP